MAIDPEATEQEREGGAPHRAGFVAILGPPNAGKSTLMNRILGEKLAIVTAKPQTTRSRILGIRNLPDAQLLLVDTPGLHASSKPLNVALNEAVEVAVRDCDMAVLLVDLTRGWSDTHQELFAGLRRAGKPVVVVGNKCDLPGAGSAEWPPPALGGELGEEAAGAPAAGDEASAEPEKGVPLVTSMTLSALNGEGVTSLLERIVERLPESPPLYSDDALTDRPLRWLVGELVREAVFECLGQELPYSMAVEVLKYDESRADLVEIHANVIVARDSQKRIVVGAGGKMIKRIGTRARREIERLVGAQVNLQLFVKIEPKWLKSSRRIEALGYS
ncbi:MAG: GTPase Era [Deltaproteobacteria bacterium]|nr:GTPase Era [Deltaproteobacteria bacterium]